MTTFQDEDAKDFFQLLCRYDHFSTFNDRQQQSKFNNRNQTNFKILKLARVYRIEILILRVFQLACDIKFPHSVLRLF